MPVPAGARTRYFPLDAEAFAASATGAPTGDDAWRDPTSSCRSLAARDLVLELFDGRTVSVQGVRAARCTMEASPPKGIDPTQIAGASEYSSWIGQATVDGSILVSASFAIVRAPHAPVVVIGSIDDATGHYGVQPAAEDGLTVLYQGPDPVLAEDGFDQLNHPGDPVPDADPGSSVPPDVDSPTPSTTTPSTTTPSTPDTSTTQPEPPTSTPGFHAAVGRAARPPTNADAMRTVTIAVVYGNGVSETSALWHAASGAVGTNASLINSHVPVEVEIVGSVVHSNYNQSNDMVDDITNFRVATDPYLNEIHVMRPAWNADLGMLVLPGDAPGHCAGLGYVPQTVEASDITAYSLQNLYGCNNTVMAHEVGHNLGVWHDPANSSYAGPLPHTPFTFSYGHFISTKGRDNMAYDTFCAPPCPTKPQYADPDIDFVGLPGHASGTATRRGADSIRLTSWGVSQLYPRTSNDHLWDNHLNRTHASVNIEASSGDDPEAPFIAIGGDFDGTYGDVFWYFPDNGPDRLETLIASAIGPYLYLKDIIGTYVPVAGDFNGDSRDDIFWHAPGAAVDWVWWGQNTPAAFGDPGSTSSFSVTGSYTPTAGDFDGDGKDDILWYSGSGPDSIWWGHASSSALGNAVSSVTIGAGLDPISGDFDGDDRDDLLFYGQGSTPDTIWWGQPARANFGDAGTTSSRSLSGTYLPAAGDFDGDGRSDVMLYGPGANSDYIWWGHGTRSTFGPGSQTTTSVSGTYASPIAGDFDEDHIDDLYWFAYG